MLLGWPLPADACAPDRNGDLTLPKLLALLDALQRRSGLADPQVMLWVGEDANVGLGRLYCAVCVAHLVIRGREGKGGVRARCRDWIFGRGHTE